MKQHPVRAARGAALCAVFALSLVAACAGRLAAQEGGTPVAPPPDSTIAPEPVPVSLQPAAPTPVAPGLRGAPAFTWGDSTGLVLPPLADVRNGNELAGDVAASRTLRASAENRMLKARERSVRWKSQVEIQKARLETLKKQIDAAKKEKREADKKDYEAQKRREERVRDYYDAMRQVMESEADWHKVTFDYAQARMSAAEIEQQLSEKWSSGGYDARVASDARGVEQRVLNAVKDRADKMSNYASKEKALADKRLAALKAWGELQK
jgi:hypothetical protein